jgi:hypothetical protein
MRLALPAGPSRAVEPGVHVCGSPAALNVSHCGVDNVQAIRFWHGFAGTEGIEPSTIGFGGRRSPVELRPNDYELVK